MAGYKRAPSQQEYRPGHRLGYLTDAEYEFANQYVLTLRQSNQQKFPSELDKLRKCLLHSMATKMLLDDLFRQSRDVILINWR
jgi:hypothetical protein